MINYSEPLFRPPAEANSLIFQISYGCPHNKCRFCGMYKGVQYHVRNFDAVKSEIKQAGKFYPETKRIFLADGDVMFLGFTLLKEILEVLNESFSNLARINTYANGSSILSLSQEELRVLRKLKLNTLYMGLESGDDEVLNLVLKGESTGDMVEAVRNAQDCGLKCSVMALLGIGGQKYSIRHAALTAESLNLMQPKILSILRYIEVPGTKMYKGYKPLTEYAAVEELYNIVSALQLRRTVFTANHASNPLPLKGRFPNDKDRLLTEITTMLNSGLLDKNTQGATPVWL